MTSARIQPFCKNYNINIGCFDGRRINPRKMTQRNISLFVYKSHFCFIWKSSDISFNQAIEDIILNFEVVDNVIFDKHFKSFVKNDYNPKKVESPLTIRAVYDLETLN